MLRRFNFNQGSIQVGLYIFSPCSSGCSSFINEINIAIAKKERYIGCSLSFGLVNFLGARNGIIKLKYVLSLGVAFLVPILTPP